MGAVYLDKAEEDDNPGSKQTKAERPNWTSKLGWLNAHQLTLLIRMVMVNIFMVMVTIMVMVIILIRMVRRLWGERLDVDG